MSETLTWESPRDIPNGLDCTLPDDGRPLRRETIGIRKASPPVSYRQGCHVADHLEKEWVLGNSPPHPQVLV